MVAPLDRCLSSSVASFIRSQVGQLSLQAVAEETLETGSSVWRSWRTELPKNGFRLADNLSLVE
jgi:hypothetical protein